MWKKEPIIIGDWKWQPYSNASHCEIISADTETKLYYNGILLDERTAYKLWKRKGQAWIKQNIEVRAYAFTISDGKNFALFQTIEDFLYAVASLNAKIVYWYNARFDFAIFDYYFLTHDWKDTTTVIRKNKRYGKLEDKTYSSLNGDFGQRYSMQIWYKYRARNGNYCVHKWKMYDICNVFGGGLRRNLIDWNITDNENNEVRKLKMDYVNADIYSDLQYMINDTKGLALLSKKINETMLELTGYSLNKGEFITAGGLAKKTLLKYMYGKEDKKNVELFKNDFPMFIALDKEFRNHKLYLGGKCLVNPKYRGCVVNNIYKYDVNSMYPDKMYKMQYPYGMPYVSKTWDIKDKRIKVLKIKNLVGYIKPNKIGIYQDYYSGDYVDYIDEFESRYIWEEELLELENWYDLFYDIEMVLYYNGKENQGAKNFIDKFYDMKCKTKGAIKLGAKLLLNSSYGKIAQRVERQTCVYRLSEDGYVHCVKSEPQVDEKSMLSVLVGSRITALARVSLMQYIREICNENVKKNFIYCDTDSVHALKEYADTDDTALGKMKCEGIYKYGLYIAPKSYLIQDFNGKYEVHCKGVNTEVVKRAINGKTFNKACHIFTANKTFKCLCGINVKGGKALVYTDKMILNDKNYVLNDTVLDGGILYEM